MPRHWLRHCAHLAWIWALCGCAAMGMAANAAAAGGGAAATERAREEPSALVAAYCRLDRDGARLAPHSPPARRMGRLVSWSFEPHWHDFTVITGYRLEPPKSGGGTTSIYVDYTVAGTLSSDRFMAKTGAERQRFDVIDFDGRLFIYRPILQPHIDAASALAYLKTQLAQASAAPPPSPSKTAPAPSRREVLRQSIAALTQTMKRRR